MNTEVSSASRKLVISSEHGRTQELERFLTTLPHRGLVLVAFHGPDCELLEGLLDDLCVGDGSHPDLSLTTSSHPNETLDDVLAFADAWLPSGDVQLVRT